MAKGLFNSSIGRKFAMALSAFFLLIFLVIHLLINLLSVFSPEAFNEASHFMGTNPVVQFALQPVLIAGVVLHFVLGFILEIRNKKARGGVSYVKKGASHNSSWMSRNMIISGAVILAFIALHFADFWIPTVAKNHFGVASGHESEYAHLVHEFSAWWRVLIYVIAFVLLGLHLAHGFQSAFQSVGANHRKYNGAIKGFGKAYAILIPLGFIFVAVFHFLNH